MTAISYHDTVNDLQGLNWSGDGPFARADWFRLLETTAHSPLIALAQDGAGAVALPLQFCDGRLEALTNWYAFSWTGLHTSPEVTESTLADLASALSKRTNRIVLGKVANEHGHVDRLQNAFETAKWIVIREESDVNHLLHVGERSFEAYLADRPGPLRTTLKRKAKKVDVSLATQFSEEDWRAYEEIYADSWKPEEGDPRLLRTFARMESEAGRYRFAIARHEGEPVAAQFWSVEQDAAYIHKLAHRQSAQSLSPGTTLTAALMQHVIDIDKVRLVDFGTGDDAYKRDWMESVRPRFRLTILRPSAPRNWPIMAKALFHKLVRR